MSKRPPSSALKRSPLGLGAGEPLAETPLHGLPAAPAAHVDRGDDLERLEPLDEALQLQEAAVLAVWDSCEKRKIIFSTSRLSSLIFNHWNLLDGAGTRHYELTPPDESGLDS